MGDIDCNDCRVCRAGTVSKMLCLFTSICNKEASPHPILSPSSVSYMLVQLLQLLPLSKQVHAHVEETGIQAEVPVGASFVDI